MKSKNVIYVQERDIILIWNDLFICLSLGKLPGVKDQVFYFYILGK